MSNSSEQFAQLKRLLQKRDEQKIIEFLEAQPDVLIAKDENRISGLMLIAYHRLAAVMPRAQQLASKMGFYESIAYGQLENVKETITQQAGLLNQAAPDGFSPLCLAAYFAQFEVAKWLTEQGAVVNQAATNPSQVAPIHAAVAANHVELVKWLIEQGADVNLPQTQGVTPLHSAAHRGNLAIVKALVEAGANVQAKMDSGETALQFAEKDGHQSVIEFLSSRI